MLTNPIPEGSTTGSTEGTRVRTTGMDVAGEVKTLLVFGYLLIGLYHLES